MTAFLDQLGEQLDAAAARIVAGGAAPRRRVWRVLVPAAAAVAAVVLVLALTGGRERPARPAPAAPRPTPTAAITAPPPAALRHVVVTVANGTTIAGLAGTYADRLHQLGWRTPLRVTNYPDQHVAQTMVVYRHPAGRATAEAVARALGLRAVMDDELPGPGPVIVLGPDAP